MSRISGWWKAIGKSLMLAALASVGLTGSSEATGISIDAGLTPAENKWILRTQVRYMQRDLETSGMNRKMEMWSFPAVLAYGIRSDLTVMAVQMVRRNEMTMGSTQSSTSGLTNLMMMAKYRMLRLNRPSYTLGIAPVVGIRIPTGEEGFGRDHWDLRAGLFVSSRLRTWSLDFNVAYDFNGLAGVKAAEAEPGNELVVQAAAGRQIPLSNDGVWAAAPVLEGSYNKVMADRLEDRDLDDSGEEILLVAPGLKITRSNVVVEGLLQVPVWQDQRGQQLERKTGFLLGIRLML